MGGTSTKLVVDRLNFLPHMPVVRGPDWKHGTEDSSSKGYTVSLDQETQLVTVRWADGSEHSHYRAKAGGGPCDLQYDVKGEVCNPDSFQKDALVCRGPDWQWAGQDGNSYGRAVSMEGEWVKVEWVANKSKNSYRAGVDGKHDIMIFKSIKKPGSSFYDESSFSTTSSSSSSSSSSPIQKSNSNNSSNNNSENNNNNNNNNNENNNNSNGHHHNDSNRPNEEAIPKGNNNNNNSSSPSSSSSATTATTAPSVPTSTSSSSSSEQLIPEGSPVDATCAVIGAWVARGVDFPEETDSCGDNDTKGTIVAVVAPNRIKVTWNDGQNVTKVYRAGGEYYDLIYAAATIHTPPTTSSTSSSSSSSSSPTSATAATSSSSSSTPAPVVGGRVHSDTAVAGYRVVRGDHWKWKDQDSSGPGLIDSVSNGWVRIKWPEGTSNSYRAGAEGCYDLKYHTVTLANSNSSASSSSGPRGKGNVSKENFVVNALVRRGPDWKWGQQDGNGTGTLLSIDSDQWIRVRWGKNSSSNSYRAGAEGGKFDVEYVPASESANSSSSSSPTSPTSSKPSSGGGDGMRVTPSNAITVSNFESSRKVVRGPDWRYADQDKSGQGRLLSIDSSGWCRVQFPDGSSNGYRSGADGKYDVVYADESNASSSSSSSHRASSSSGSGGLVTRESFSKYGAFSKVIRGPDWSWGDQDKAGPGTLANVDSESWARIKWPDGTSNSYRAGVEGKHDLMWANPFPTSSSTSTSSSSSASSPPRNPTSSSSSSSATTTTTTTSVEEASRGLTPVSRSNFVSGATVVKHPRWWKWGSQDGDAEGRLVSIDADNWVRVKWLKTGIANSYRGGVSGAFDIAYPAGRVPSSTPAPTASPPAPPSRPATATSNVSSPPPPSSSSSSGPKDGEKVCRENWHPGAKIRRGGDWRWGDQDKGGEGKLLSIDTSDWVKVQWQDGNINSYRGGANGCYDLVYGGKKSAASPLSNTKNLPPVVPTDNSEDACVICLENEKFFALVPCGHLCICQAEACVAGVEKRKTCPVCREPFQMMMRIFK